MSTKSSIVYGDNFHFYTDLADENNNGVWLRLEGNDIEYQVFKNSVSVRIPLYIWESIRSHSLVDFSVAEKTDEDLQKECEESVDERIKEYNEADDRMKSFFALAGCMFYGDIESPREEQIANAMKNKKARRDNIQKIIQKMNESKNVNKG